MTAKPSLPGQPPHNAMTVLSKLLDCDKRTRRAIFLMFAASTSAAVLLLALFMPLVITLGASGTLGGGALTALALTLARRRPNGEAS